MTPRSSPRRARCGLRWRCAARRRNRDAAARLLRHRGAPRLTHSIAPSKRWSVTPATHQLPAGAPTASRHAGVDGAAGGAQRAAGGGDLRCRASRRRSTSAVVYLTLALAGLNREAIQVLPIVPLAAFFAILNGGYLVAFIAASGQTIGKMAMGIRVMGDDGRRVDVGGAVLRAAGLRPVAADRRSRVSARTCHRRRPRAARSDRRDASRQCSVVCRQGSLRRPVMSASCPSLRARSARWSGSPSTRRCGSSIA